MSETVRLDSIAKVAIGATPARNNEAYWGGENVWVSIAELNGGTITDSREHITDLGVERSPSKLVHAGSILFSFKLSIGKMATAGVDLYTNEAIAAISVLDESKVFPRYLYHALARLNASQEAHTAVMGAMLNSAKVKALEVPLPPIEEQRRIAELLDDADRLQRLRKEANEKAQRILPALFTHMFGDPETNPMGWTVVSVSDFVQRFQSGKSIASGGDGTPTKHRVLKVSSVSSGYFLADESKPVSDVYNPPKDHFVREGDLLLSRASGSAELVGVTALVDQPVENLLLPDKLWRFVWRSDRKVEPAWALALFQHPFIRAEIAHTASGISMRNIPMGKVLEMRVPLPPLEAQSRFASLASDLLATAISQSNSSAITDRLLTTLRSRLFAEAV